MAGVLEALPKPSPYARKSIFGPPDHSQDRTDFMDNFLKADPTYLQKIFKDAKDFVNLYEKLPGSYYDKLRRSVQPDLGTSSGRRPGM